MTSGLWHCIEIMACFDMSNTMTKQRDTFNIIKSWERKCKKRGIKNEDKEVNKWWSPRDYDLFDFVARIIFLFAKSICLEKKINGF